MRVQGPPAAQEGCRLVLIRNALDSAGKAKGALPRFTRGCRWRCLPASHPATISPFRQTRDSPAALNTPCYYIRVGRSGSQAEITPPTSAGGLFIGRGNKSVTQSYSIIMIASIGTLEPRIADLRNAAGFVTLLALGTSFMRCRSRRGDGRAVDRRIATRIQHRIINYRGRTSSRCKSPMKGNPWLSPML
jgi:hypothetical protein